MDLCDAGVRESERERKRERKRERERERERGRKRSKKDQFVLKNMCMHSLIVIG